MAASITTAATTLEGQCLECVESLAVKQASATDNPNGTVLITTYSRDMATGAITVTMTIPTVDTLNAGAISISATEVFQ